MIECTTIDGQKILIPRDKLQFRPAAYAIIFHLDQILLLNTRTTGNYSLPGGGVEIGETLSDGLMREVEEETGIDIEIAQLCHFSEEFFYYEPTDEAFQSYRFFYLCQPRTMTLALDNAVKDEEVEKPRWVRIQNLQVDDFQSHGNMIMKQIVRWQTRLQKEMPDGLAN